MLLEQHVFYLLRLVLGCLNEQTDLANGLSSRREPCKECVSKAQPYRMSPMLSLHFTLPQAAASPFLVD